MSRGEELCQRCAKGYSGHSSQISFGQRARGLPCSPPPAASCHDWPGVCPGAGNESHPACAVQADVADEPLNHHPAVQQHRLHQRREIARQSVLVTGAMPTQTYFRVQTQVQLLDVRNLISMANLVKAAGYEGVDVVVGAVGITRLRHYVTSTPGVA